MDEQLGRRFGGGLAAQLGRADPGVHVALAEPDAHVGAARGAPYVGSEELVGQERTSRCAGMEATTCTALAEVQHRSDSALTSALVLT